MLDTNRSDFITPPDRQPNCRTVLKQNNHRTRGWKGSSEVTHSQPYAQSNFEQVTWGLMQPSF